jgi:hypothetical protein
MVQHPSNHIIIGKKLWPCFYLMHLRLSDDFLFGGQVVFLVITGIIWTIYQLGLQNVGDIRPCFDSIDTSRRGIRNNI